MGDIVRPNVGKSMEAIVNERRKKSRLPVHMASLIESLLVEFKFDESRTADVAKHVLDSDVDVALEDSVPMKVFFGMCANKYEEKEEAAAEKIRILIESGMNSSDKITVQKGRAKSTPQYKELAAKKIRYHRMKSDCRTLEKAMEMRKDIAQTKSANYRLGLQQPNQSNPI